MLTTYFVSYLVFNIVVAMVITGLFAASGTVLLRAIVRCSTAVPVATVRILALVYGTLALGRVFLNVAPGRGQIDDSGALLVKLSEATGTNLMFLAILAGFGMVALLLAARPVVNLLTDMDARQDKALGA